MPKGKRRVVYFEKEDVFRTLYTNTGTQYTTPPNPGSNVTQPSFTRPPTGPTGAKEPSTVPVGPKDIKSAYQEFQKQIWTTTVSKSALLGDTTPWKPSDVWQAFIPYPYSTTGKHLRWIWKNVPSDDPRLKYIYVPPPPKFLKGLLTSKPKGTKRTNIVITQPKH